MCLRMCCVCVSEMICLVMVCMVILKLLIVFGMCRLGVLVVSVLRCLFIRLGW